MCKGIYDNKHDLGDPSCRDFPPGAHEALSEVIIGVPTATRIAAVLHTVV